MEQRQITVSVVSHGQNALVNLLLADLERLCAPEVRLIVTENVPDAVALETNSLASPVRLISNPKRKGFGANHNAAFAHCATPFFAVVNPDVRLQANPFPALMQALQDSGAAVAGPQVRDSEGVIQDSARRFPTAGSLIRKALGAGGATAGGGLDVASEVDWVAGMFMLFRAEAFRAVGGFDERYFLYYEDADICRRLHAAGLGVRYEPAASVVHDAQRGSHRSPRLAARHLASMVRFLVSS